MKHPEPAHHWAIVLAGGSGTRLASLTRDRDGHHVPKQYCSFGGGRSLLGDALARASSVVAPERVLVVVAEAHRPLWEVDLAGHERDNLVVQPNNRGTAPGVLLPLVTILERDADATIALFPSDHFVLQEAVVAAAVQQALLDSQRAPEQVELLGIEPDAEEHEYGWIVPGPATGGTRAVELFVEKPGPARARELRDRGAVWNSFILVSHATTLVKLYQLRLPQLLWSFLLLRPHADVDSARALYDLLPTSDFSRDLLTSSLPDLRVRIVPECGWTDLGTPQRVAACMHEHHRLKLAHSNLRASQSRALPADA